MNYEKKLYITNPLFVFVEHQNMIKYVLVLKVIGCIHSKCNWENCFKVAIDLQNYSLNPPCTKRLQ